MKRIVTREEMRQSEQCAIQEHFISSLILMERAALTVCEVLHGECLLSGRILVVCGIGNNGGDGLAIARILYERGYEADVVLLGDRSRCTVETQQQLKCLQSYGVAVYDQIPQRAYTVIIDAIFGIGLTRDIGGVYYETIDRLNGMPGTKLAVDIPSGLDADTGAVRGIVFRADITVTFAYAKLGMYRYPGTFSCGRICVRDIGIKQGMLPEPAVMMYEDRDRILPERIQPSHKGTYGKVLLAAGSDAICGAAVLSAEAALRTGAGMVKIVTSVRNRETLMKRLPESMLLLYDAHSMEDEAYRTELLKALEWADVIGIGPGLSEAEPAGRLLEFILANTEKPLVLDADALNILAEKQTMWRQNNEVILTPHVKEMERLCGKPASEIAGDPFETARNYAAEHHAVCVLKDARTVTAEPGGNCFLNIAGNSGMATAGSGDVLTGIICALKAQGMPAYEAASAGVYLHALAGDRAAAEKSEYGMIASDMIMKLTDIESELMNR